MLSGIFLHPLGEALLISVFVVAMMVVMELVDLRSNGTVVRFLQKRNWSQRVIAGLLGAIPGCLGGYAAVSLYSGKVFSFGALVAMMIATTGDEAFLMLAQFPRTAVLITLGLFATGLVVGWVCDLIISRKKGSAGISSCTNPSTAGKAGISGQNATEARLEADAVSKAPAQTGNFWHRALHIIKAHALKIFLWVYGIMVLLGILGQWVDISTWISDNTALMVLIAALVGLIPESGPHLVFVTMYAGGLAPLSVLLANCISQDGHASLPLLAENKKSFFAAKLIKFVLALIVGYTMLLL